MFGSFNKGGKMTEKLKEAIKKALIKIECLIDEIEIEVPSDIINGDFSTNIAMKLSKQLKKNPKEIATLIADNIKEDYIEKIEIAGPGFINFYLKKDYLYENINEILNKKEQYGKGKTKNKKINLEFVSANPTGALHIGHGRGAAYGSSLANILMFLGFDVTREYYINDGGNQINNLNKSIRIRYNNLCGINDELEENHYHGKELIEVAKNIYEKYGKDATDDIINEYGIDYLLQNIKKDLQSFRTYFDIWTSERKIYESGKVEKSLKYLIDKNYTYEQEGAIYLKTTMFEDDKDRVLVKSDKTNTYLLPDIAYHVDKYERGYDSLIDVLGADHHGYINRLKASIKMMGYDEEKLTVKILQMVRLLKDNEEIKVSKRTGKTITLNELIEEVGIDATRYFFISKSLDTQLDFDINVAKSKTNENPVYYIQYAYARICSVLSSYKKEINTNIKYSKLNSETAYKLLVKLYEFPQTIEISCKKLSPHVLTNYLYELAALFHSFYNSEKILSDDEIETQEKVSLVKATSIVIKNALNLLEIEAKERM